VSRIVVSGMVAADTDQGGAAWAVLQYVVGLQRLGHDVLLVEQMAADALQPTGTALADSANAAYFALALHEAQVDSGAALLLEGSGETFGRSYDELRQWVAGADLLLNVSGILTDPALFGEVPVRAYLDLDPAFNQLWQEQGIDMRFAGHTHFVTVGQAIGEPGCPVPTLGLDWIPTVPPVVLDRWPAADGPGDAWTTIGNWRGYGSVEQDGVHYGQKAHSMREYIELPEHVEARFRMALGIHSGEAPDLDALDRHGWPLVDPLDVAATPRAYQAFVRGSRGELGVAKSGYVLSRCGWFSDRSACYLASGRPVVAQETGWSAFLPAGEGLLSFSDTASAAAAIDEVEAGYERHARAARALAEAHLDSDRVLGRLLERLLG
jgi:hypothetical protein